MTSFQEDCNFEAVGASEDSEMQVRSLRIVSWPRPPESTCRESQRQRPLLDYATACLVILRCSLLGTHAHKDGGEKYIFPNYAGFGSHVSKMSKSFRRKPPDSLYSRINFVSYLSMLTKIVLS